MYNITFDELITILNYKETFALAFSMSEKYKKKIENHFGCTFDEYIKMMESPFIPLTPIKRLIVSETNKKMFLDNYHLFVNINNLCAVGVGNEFLKEIYNFKKLICLQIQRNNISSLPKEIGNLKNLELLYLSSNNISSLPKEICDLQKLKYLILEGNNFTYFPEEICQLNSLKEIVLKNNFIGDLPKEISNLKNLEILDLSCNNLRYFPKEILELEGLNELYISKNEIKNIPDGISNMTNLKTLSLQGNLMQTLPLSLKNVTTIFLGNDTNENLRNFVKDWENICYFD